MMPKERYGTSCSLVFNIVHCTPVLFPFRSRCAAIVYYFSSLLTHETSFCFQIVCCISFPAIYLNPYSCTSRKPAPSALLPFAHLSMDSLLISLAICDRGSSAWVYYICR